MMRVSPRVVPRGDRAPGSNRPAVTGEGKQLQFKQTAARVVARR
jgi:hypothetical protein